MRPLQPSHHKFRGKLFCIRWRPPTDADHVGSCDDPRYKRPSMVIHPDLRSFEKLMTLVDESIHACQFDLDNEVVSEMSSSIAGFLWDCGLRFRDEMLNQALQDAILPPLA